MKHKSNGRNELMGERLSPVARKIKKLLEQGKTIKQIAKELKMSTGRIGATMQRYRLGQKFPEEEIKTALNGLGPRHESILQAIANHPFTTREEIAAETGLHPDQVYTGLKFLKRSGLVSSTTRERPVHYSLTGKGKFIAKKNTPKPPEPRRLTKSRRKI